MHRWILPVAILLGAAPVAAAPGPDLSAGNLTLASGTPGAGEPVFLSLVVRNGAPDAAGPFRVKAMLSPTLPVTVRDAEIGSTEVASIPGGGEITVDLDAFIPAATAPGKYRLGAFIDPENLVLDGIRSNNGAATATFTVVRAHGAMDLGDDIDAGLGPLGQDAMDVPIPAGGEAILRAKGVRGVRPILRVRAPGGGAVLAEKSGAASALLRFAPETGGIYRVEVQNQAETVGRVRLQTAGEVRVRRAPAAAPGSIPFPAWEDGTVILDALYDGAASPLLFRPALGPDVSGPGRVRGRRARLGPLVPQVTGTGALVLGGEGAAEVSITSKTPRVGALLVR